MREVDVLIAGAGPAGAVAALNLAPLWRVAVIERNAEPSPRIGESLAPAARRLFTDMGMWESFLAGHHEPCHGQRSVWGEAEVRESGALRDPDGSGWHIDRPRFERWLREVAIARGAQLIAPATFNGVSRDGDAWIATTGSEVIRANLLIDAGGRAAPLARRIGAKTHALDRLVCGWVYGRDSARGSRGMTYVEAVEDGWWYTAPIPGARRVLAFHTDSDLPAAGVAADRGLLLRRAAETDSLARWLHAAGFVADGESGFTAAHSAMLDPVAGDGFFAAGDAAIAFDPLSSQGLFNALYTGLAAAEAADATLRGEPAIDRYRNTIASIATAYQRHLGEWYALEQRWPDAPFWRRRHANVRPDPVARINRSSSGEIESCSRQIEFVPERSNHPGRK